MLNSGSFQWESMGNNCYNVKTLTNNNENKDGKNDKIKKNFRHEENNPQRLLSKYYLLSKLGTGSFADVYVAYRMSDRKCVAVKIEKRYDFDVAHNSIHQHKSKLMFEYDVYNDLHSNHHYYFIPKIYDFIQTTEYNMMVLQLFGKSLSDMYDKCNKTFQLPTIFAISIQLIMLIEKLHTSGYLHRDIKPNNFLLGTKRKDKIFITDFGLSKKYIKNGEHIKYKEGTVFVGTARYSGINVHDGIETSRRDDLESIGYMLIFFMKGTLPWQGLGRDKPRNDMIKVIGDVKKSTSVMTLCAGLPPCFSEFMLYCRNLKFDETPSYKVLIKLFVRDAIKLNINPRFEWE